MIVLLCAFLWVNIELSADFCDHILFAKRIPLALFRIYFSLNKHNLNILTKNLILARDYCFFDLFDFECFENA